MHFYTFLIPFSVSGRQPPPSRFCQSHQITPAYQFMRGVDGALSVEHGRYFFYERMGLDFHEKIEMDETTR